ncbi:hypothetical protein QCA50_013139 [Cerrena zonata]|uniref:Uncharacterized protein n=1 Tax=Cerrena zonata TaxID=2478898 RepID=A0AAW0G1H0_9APHY
MAHLVVLDHALTRITTPTKRTLVRCRDGTIATRLWFWTERLSNAQMDRIAGVQLATRSSDQGWVDSDPELGPQVWFDVGAIPSLPTPPKQDTIHLVTVKHTKALATLEGHGERSKEDVEDTIEAVMALDTRWRRSYGCPSEQAKTVQLERPVFTCDDGMWARAESDTSTRDIAVRACAMFRGWTTHARWGKLTVWKHFEPIVRV